MAASLFPKNFTDGLLTLQDGTGAPLTQIVTLAQGNFNLSGVQDKLRTVAAYQTRAVLRGLRLTELSFPTFSLSAIFDEFSSAVGGSIADMILADGAHAARISTSGGGANADVDTLNLILAVEGTDYGDGADHTITLGDCHIIMDLGEGDPNTLTLNGTVYGAISGDWAEGTDFA